MAKDFLSDVDFKDNLVTLTSTDAGSSAAPILELYRNSASAADSDYIGQIKFQGENDNDQKVVYAKITGKISDASDTTEDGIIEIAHQKAGSNNISARFTSTALKLINGTGLEVADGLLTLGSTAVTATAAELNILDGVTATATELNILDGVTSTTAELNILDGVTSTAAELNLVDGITAGTVSASLAVIADSNKDVTGFRNVTATGIVDAVNFKVNGGQGSDGQVLTSTGSGVAWENATGGGGSPGGSNTQIQFNNSGSFGGSSNLTFDGTNLTLAGDATIGDTLILTGNAVSHISNNTSANREILQFRGKTALSDGAGMNIYGDGDSSHAGKIKMWTNNTERFVLDNSGGFQFNGTLTVGENDTGHDVLFWGATAGSYFFWDESLGKMDVSQQATSATLTDFTQAIDKATINIVGDYSADHYQGMIVWTTDDDNSAKPKAGQWIKTTSSGVSMLFGTSNSYGTGITNEALEIKHTGSITNTAATPVLIIADTAASNDQNDVQSTIHLAGRYHSGTANPLADQYSDAQIQLYKDNSDGNGGAGLIFKTSATGTGGLTERLRITKARTIIAQTEDVTGSAETGCLILGDPAGTHIAFDNNEIMAKDAADSASPLYLQNVDDSGADIRFGNYDSGNGDYMQWDGGTDDLVFYGASFIDFDGRTQSSAMLFIDLPHGYGMYCDNAGSGTDNSRLWFNGPDEGECVIGPRAGASTFDRVRLRADTISCEGALTKSSGSFDIPHPTKGGDWRLRHSFIEGPTCDNIYRGTATISGSSVSIDLDAVSGMTEGTWLALNTNPWSMVASSGNAVTWDLDGKTLTINGPDGAVCSWMVIGERKDPSIVSSKLTDNNGKLVVEYEQVEIEADEIADTEIVQESGEE